MIKIFAQPRLTWSCGKNNGTGKKIKVNLTGSRSFNIYFCVIFSFYGQRHFQKQTGLQVVPPTSFEIFLVFLSFPRSQVLIRSVAREVTLISSSFYQKSRRNLLVANKIYTNIWRCFVILFPQLSEKKLFCCLRL